MTVLKKKQQKAQKKCGVKRKFKFQNYKNCLEAAQTKNKINSLEKKIRFELKKLILKAQQRFESESVFTEEITRLFEVQMMIKEYNQLNI